MNESKSNNKLILGIYAEKSKEKIRQNSYNGLIKTEEAHLAKKNISINKRSFLAKINNFSPFNAKNKKDISINNENINNILFWVSSIFQKIKMSHKIQKMLILMLIIRRIK